ncbi:MAG TPA: response regulator, partial [Polyangiaceae bacterium]
ELAASISKHGASPDALAARGRVLAATVGGAALAGLAWLVVLRFFVTPRVRETEATLQTLEHEAARARERARRLGAIVTSLGHESRAPLNGVIGMTDLMIASDLAGRHLRYAESVQASAHVLQSLMNELLDLGKLEAGRLDVRFTSCDPRRTVDEVLRVFTAKARARGLELTTKVGPNVPELVRCDRERVSQLLTRLVAHAVRSGDRGEILVELQAKQDRQQRLRLIFAVDHPGPGLSGAEKAGLFGGGAEIPRKNGKNDVSALVLAREIARGLGGELGAANEPGSGNRIWFEVPVEESRRPARVEQGLHFPLKALVVDDNLTNLAALRELLSGWGMKVRCASGGDDALEQLRTAIRDDAPFELVLVDDRMPRMSGAELARSIRVDLGLRSLPIVMLASELGAEVGDARTYVDEVLAKPASRRELGRTIELALEEHRTRPSGRRRRNSERPSGGRSVPRGRFGRATRVLVAEEEAGEAEPLAKTLERFGCEVERAGTTREVLEALTHSDYALVVLDVKMAGLDGYETVRRIRAGAGTRTRIPMVAVTSLAAAGERARAILAGMDDYVAKPIGEATLRALLERWLGAGPPAARNGAGHDNVAKEPVR